MAGGSFSGVGFSGMFVWGWGVRALGLKAWGGEFGVDGVGHAEQGSCSCGVVSPRFARDIKV